jgi:hypothetical protein
MTQFNLLFVYLEPKCFVQASTVTPPESIWEAQYPSKEDAETTLKAESLIATDAILPPQGIPLLTKDVSDQALIIAGFRHAERALHTA